MSEYDLIAHYLRKGATSFSIFGSIVEIGLGLFTIVLYATGHHESVALLAKANLGVPWGIAIGVCMILSGITCAVITAKQMFRYWIIGLIHLIVDVPLLAVYQAPLIWIGPLLTSISALLYLLLAWRTRHNHADENIKPLAESSKTQISYDTKNPAFQE